MTKKISLEVVRPDSEVIKKEVEAITLPTSEGEITILPGHSPLIAPLGHGSMIVSDEKIQEIYTILGGFIQVQADSKVLILADASEHISEVDEEKAREAKEKAEAELEGARDDQERFAEVNAELLRSLTRIKLAKRYKKGKNRERIN